jgi:3-methyladenine DNA glycosylase AlkC
MEPFKNSFNKKTVTTLAKELTLVEESFNATLFKKNILKELEELELKDRVRLISNVLHEIFSHELNYSYKKTIQILLKALKKKDSPLTGFQAWPISQYVEDYGRDDLKTSLKAMYIITKLFTSEFCIRPFIDLYPDEVFSTLHEWTSDECEHIRRFASEGTRPNLPWGLKVRGIHENLNRNIELLEKLKYDEHDYVIKSIANHLNDISRLDEKLFLKTVQDWNKDKRISKKIIRHSSRTLLKQGHPKALKLHGYDPKININLSGLKLSKKKIKEGDRFDLSFDLVSLSNSSKTNKIIVEYIIHYPKKDGSLSPKAFRLKDTTILSGSRMKLLKSIHFKNVTTRKHYKGEHLLEIQVNGQKLDATKFLLV